MDVGIAEFRAQLSKWLDLVGGGHEVVITDRDVPVARLVGIESGPILERLTREGVIGRPRRPARPKAGGQRGPRAKRPVAAHVSEQRR